MNHYPHHIGDFNNATRHLTRVERSLYRDLIEMYYDTEQPLPGGDFERLAKRILAVSDEEKAALKAVLGEFFTTEEGTYRNARCDREIAKYQGLRESASRAGKVSAERRLNAKPTPVKRPLKSRSTNQNQEPEPNIKPSAGFLAFWEGWPRSERKQAAGKCWEAWTKQKLESLAEQILAHITVLKKSDGWRGGYIPAPLVYLHERRWEGADLTSMPLKVAAA